MKKKSPNKSPKKPKSSGLLRGVALVEKALKKRAEEEELEGSESLPDDFKLSPSLKAWLEKDDTFFTLGEPTPIGELLRDEFGEDWGSYFEEVEALLNKGDCVLFEGWGSDSRRFIYLGAKDSLGEYPVFTVDTDDTPYVCLNGPVDVWLAQQAGAIAGEKVYGWLPAAYEASRLELAKKCFKGFIAHVDGAFSREL